MELPTPTLGSPVALWVTSVVGSENGPCVGLELDAALCVGLVDCRRAQPDKRVIIMTTVRTTMLFLCTVPKPTLDSLLDVRWPILPQIPGTWQPALEWDIRVSLTPVREARCPSRS